MKMIFIKTISTCLVTQTRALITPIRNPLILIKKNRLKNFFYFQTIPQTYNNLTKFDTMKVNTENNDIGYFGNPEQSFLFLTE